ncbi:MAG: PQQ-binding-like beta-propeller repeat protein [Chloroflexi bacterium]|nr:PQQ-binding-like beta-propeller repeat protein [Chloroflexota bacterium]
MTSQQSLERLVAGWMAQEAPAGSDAEFIDRIVAVTVQKQPRPAWLALLLESPMRRRSRVAVGSPMRRMAFVVALVLMGAIAALGVGAILLTQQTPPEDWSGFRGGPGHDGLGGAGPVGNPIARWTVPLGAPIRNNISVLGGLAIVPTEDGVLHAIRLSDGSEQWTYRAGTSLTGPAGLDDLVYVRDGRGTLHALEVATGTERWSVGGAVGSASSPTISDGSIYVGTSDGHVVAFDARSGERRWDREVAPSNEIIGSPAAGAGLVFAASPSGGLVALRAATGDVVWRLDTGGDPLGTVSYADGTAYVGAPSEDSSGRLRAVDVGKGLLRWVVDEPLSSPSVVGSRVISGSDHGVLSGRDAATGTELWRLNTKGINRAPAIAGGIAYVAADADRQVLAIDLETGHVLWRTPVDGENQCCLAVARGLVLAGTMNGTVYAIAGDGQLIGPSRAFASAIATAPPATVAPSPSVSTPATTASPLVDPFTITRRIDPADLGLGSLLGLVVAPSGEIYVTDQSDHVTRLDATGRVVGSWGGSGSAHGQFDFSPASSSENVHGSIGVGPEGTVYVSDSDNHRVQVVSPTGAFIRQFGSIESGRDQFALAYDLTADAAGNVYVLDDGLRNLRKFSSTGKRLWTADETTDAVLDGHGHTATLDAQGRIVLVNDDLGKVVYVDADRGTVVDSFDANGCDAAVDSKGNVFVSGCGTAQTQVFDVDHRLISASDRGISMLRFGPDGRAVALDQTGAILFLTVTLPPS